MATTKTRVYVTLDHEVEQAVRKLAKSKKVSMSRVIQDLVLIALALKGA